MITLKNLSSIDDLSQVVKEHGEEKLCVLVFSGATCTPCKILKMKIERAFEVKYPNVAFFYILIEDNGQILNEPEFNDIKQVPTIRFARILKTSMTKVFQLSDEVLLGADEKKLDDTIKRLSV